MPSDRSDIFISLIEQHKGIVYKIASLYCRDAENRKDLVQEILLQLWRSFDRYNSQFRHSTWIYRIALNVAISFSRKESTRQKIAHPFTEEILLAPETHQKDDQQENMRLLQQFIHELKELDRALMLLYLEEKSHTEIAGIIGISQTNVATRIGRLKTLLKQRFSRINTP